MKKISLILIAVLINAIALADDVIEIKMSDVQDKGHVFVKPGKEYYVNLSGYKIPEEAKLIIFHVMDSPRSHYYYQKIKPEKFVYLMSLNELKTSTGSPPFNGLKNNDSAFLIIGSEVQPGSIDMGILYSYESVSIVVKK